MSMMDDFRRLPGESSSYASHTRMGSLSVFALVVIVLLAILAALSFTTSRASFVMANRQAVAVEHRYLVESSAQEFIAQLDNALYAHRGAASASDSDESSNLEEDTDESGASASASSAARTSVMNSVHTTLSTMCAHARDAGKGVVQVEASIVANRVYATFALEDGRKLSVEVLVNDNATYEIESWKLSTVENIEPSNGRLYIAG